MTKNERIASILLEAADLLREDSSDIKKTKYTIIPHKSVGPIKFGMSRDDVSKIMKNYRGNFLKTKNSKETTDDFENIHIYYKNNKVSEVEFFDSFPYLKGNQITPDGSILRQLDPNVIKKNGSIISEKFGIAVGDSDGSSVVVFE